MKGLKLEAIKRLMHKLQHMPDDIGMAHEGSHEMGDLPMADEHLDKPHGIEVKVSQVKELKKPSLMHEMMDESPDEEKAEMEDSSKHPLDALEHNHESVKSCPPDCPVRMGIKKKLGY